MNFGHTLKSKLTGAKWTMDGRTDRLAGRQLIQVVATTSSRCNAGLDAARLCSVEKGTTLVSIYCFFSFFSRALN
jgi:hypothetical protein